MFNGEHGDNAMTIERLSKQAQNHANATGEAMAIFNLNRVGAPMLVIRAATSFPGENRMIAGPFHPQKQEA